MTPPAGPPGVALFGGSFDPPHVGHVFMAAYALSNLGVARVLAVPVYAHAFDKPLAPFRHRLRMTELAFELLPAVTVLPIEEELGAPSRTLRTVEELQRRDPSLSLRLLVGADVLADRDRWLSWEELARRAPPLVVGRAGVSHPEAPEAVLPDVSSTRIREALREPPGSATREGVLRTFVPEKVREYIDLHHLYR